MQIERRASVACSMAEQFQHQQKRISIKGCDLSFSKQTQSVASTVPSKILVSAKSLANVRKPPDKFWRTLLNKRLHQF